MSVYYRRKSSNIRLVKHSLCVPLAYVLSEQSLESLSFLIQWLNVYFATSRSTEKLVI